MQAFDLIFLCVSDCQEPPKDRYSTSKNPLRALIEEGEEEEESDEPFRTESRPAVTAPILLNPGK